MTAIALILLLAPQDSADKVRALVEKLGSEEAAEREMATSELIKLGPAALPAIREHLAKAEGEGEGKTRLQGVIKALERSAKVAQLTAPGPRVTLKVKDRPAAEVLAEIAKQSGMQVLDVGLPAETRLSLEAEGLSPAAAIDELCRRHGRIMFQWSPSGVRLRPEPYRKVPVFDAGPFRFVVHSLKWSLLRDDGTGCADFPTFQGGLVVPPGRMPPEAAIVIESMEDDAGTVIKEELVHDPDTNLAWDGHEPHVFNPLTWIGRPPPAAGAKRLKSCRGHVRLTYVLATRPLATVKCPLAAPTSKSGGDGIGLEVLKWTREGGALELKFALILDATSSEDDRMPSRKRFALHDAQGRWVFGRTAGMSSFELRGRFRTVGAISFQIPPGFEVASFDFLGPSDEEAVKVPFDLGEVPLQ